MVEYSNFYYTIIYKGFLSSFAQKKDEEKLLVKSDLFNLHKNILNKHHIENCACADTQKIISFP